MVRVSRGKGPSPGFFSSFTRQLYFSFLRPDFIPKGNYFCMISKRFTLACLMPFMLCLTPEMLIISQAPKQEIDKGQENKRNLPSPVLGLRMYTGPRLQTILGLMQPFHCRFLFSSKTYKFELYWVRYLERHHDDEDDNFISSDTTADLSVRQWVSKCGPGTNSINKSLGPASNLQTLMEGPSN